MATERYFVGPRLLGDMRDTISRVQGEAYSVTGGHLPGRPEGLGRLSDSDNFRMATFTGAWSINSDKTVTLKYQTATPNTVGVTNLLFDFPEPSGSVDCGIASEGTAWFLIGVPFETATAVVVTGTSTLTYATSTASQNVLTDISISGSLNTETCAITINSTLTTASISILGETATAVAISGSQTSTIVRFKVT